MSATTIIKMTRVERPKFRLTQQRLRLKLAEANVLIERLLDRGIIPNLTLHPCPSRGPLARHVGCRVFKRARR